MFDATGSGITVHAHALECALHVLFWVVCMLSQGIFVEHLSQLPLLALGSMREARSNAKEIKE